MSNIRRWALVVSGLVFLGFYFAYFVPVIDAFYRTMIPLLPLEGKETVDVWVNVGVYVLPSMLEVGLVIWAIMPRKETRRGYVYR